MASRKPAKRDILYIGVIVVLALVLAFMFLEKTITLGSQKQALDTVENVYRMLTDSDVEVLSVKDEGYVYKMLVRLKLRDGDVIRELYVTKDGRFLTENIMDVPETVTRLGKEKNFTECLKARGFIVFGQKSEPNTLQQLSTIGNYANKVYVDCTGANLQACQRLGIKEIPSIVYNNKVYTGVKSLEWIESLTGCKF